MKHTNHMQSRMNQRGISQDMVELAFQLGDTDHDNRTVLGRKAALKRLLDLQRETRVLKKILDKGGIVVVAEKDALITTYNYN